MLRGLNKGWMQAGIWELGLRRGVGGKLAGSPAVLGGVLAGWCDPESRTVQLNCLTAGLVPALWILLSVAWPPTAPLIRFFFFLFQLKDNKVFDVPVAVIAGNRPNYLYR